jgi:hypothetical protein
MNGFTMPDTLPVIAAVEALPGVCAVLTLADGSQVTVSPSDRPSLITLASPEDVALVIRWEAGQEGSMMYRVPAALSGRMAWALGCRPRPAPTLTAVHRTPDAVTFTALQNGGYICTLTAPRTALMRLTASRTPGQPARLTVTDQREGSEDQQPRVFFFEVYPEGVACLEALGMSGQVSPLEVEA